MIGTIKLGAEAQLQQYSGEQLERIWVEGRVFALTHDGGVTILSAEGQFYSGVLASLKLLSTDDVSFEAMKEAGFDAGLRLHAAELKRVLSDLEED